MPQSKVDHSLPDGYRRVAGTERPLAKGAELIGALEPKSELTVIFVVRERSGSPAMPGLAYWRKIPPGKRKFLAPAEFDKLYGADQADLAAVASFAEAKGLTVVESHSGRCHVIVKGTVSQLNAALGITINQYRSPRRIAPRGVRGRDRTVPPKAGTVMEPHHGFEGQIALPQELTGVVTAVIGLDNRRLGTRAAVTGDPPGADYFSIPDIAQQYQFPNTGASGITVGIFADAQDGAAYVLADITTYINSLPAGYKTQPILNPIGLTVGSTTYSNNNAGGGTDEITFDISIVAAIAQGATINVYFTEFTEAGWETYLTRVISPEPGDGTPSVITASWLTTDEDDFGTANLTTISALFQKAANRGITAFCAAGDWGANDAVGGTLCHVGYPASEPWLTSCGGTIASSQGGVLTEWVWSDADSTRFLSGDSTFGSTGGGVSDFFAVPDYQQAVGLNPASLNPGAKTGRGVPDVAGMVAYNGFTLNGASGYEFVGTSCVAPLYAGLMAVVNKTLGQYFGFLNPTLYALRGSICHDVTYGNNDSAITPDAPYYTAGAGWDACTGWGSINGAKLVNSLKQLASVYILGGYQSPDIILTSQTPPYNTIPLGGAPGGRWDTLLAPDTPFTFSANVHNDSDTAADNVAVSFWAIPGGAGTNGTFLDKVTVASIPPYSTVTVTSSVAFTSAPAGDHMCAVVSLYNPATGCTTDPGTNALSIPSPGLAETHACSAWRNTDSMIGAPGGRFQFNLGLGELPLRLPEPVMLEINSVHVPFDWNLLPKVQELKYTLDQTGVRSNIALFLLPDFINTFRKAELQPKLTHVRGGKIEPKENGTWNFFAGGGKELTLFEVSGVIPANARVGDVIVVRVSANYPAMEKRAPRTVEFVETIYIKKEVPKR